MEAIIVTKNNRDGSIKKAIDRINSGGLVVARADTSYAILSRPDNANARRALSKIKTSRGNKQYALFVDSHSYILENVRMSHRSLVEKLLPGAVSIVIDKNVSALRYIKNNTINEIVSKCGQLTATSANPSGLEPACDIAQLEKYFSKTDILALYEGVVKNQKPSTIIDVSGTNINILRQGDVKVEIVS